MLLCSCLSTAPHLRTTRRTNYMLLCSKACSTTCAGEQQCFTSLPSARYSQTEPKVATFQRSYYCPRPRSCWCKSWKLHQFISHTLKLCIWLNAICKTACQASFKQHASGSCWGIWVGKTSVKFRLSQQELQYSVIQTSAEESTCFWGFKAKLFENWRYTSVCVYIFSSYELKRDTSFSFTVE